MLKPESFKGKFPHYIDEGHFFFSIKNSVYTGRIEELSKAMKIGKYVAGPLVTMGLSFDIFKRIGRFGFHSLKPFRGGLIGIQKDKIVFKDKDSSEFKVVFTGFRGSRPLNIYVDSTQSWASFGEYFGNGEREAVKIFSTDDGHNWKECFQFKAGEIRHIHGLIADPFRNGIWCLTGDSDAESALWFTADRFETLEKVAFGSQKARAVEIIPVEKGLIVPMDSPLEKNYINFFDLERKEFSRLESLPGSAFHAIKSNGIYFVTTVTEPSEVNVTDKATIYASLDGYKWKCLYEFERDIFPVKYQGITRYSEVIIPEGENKSEYIIGYVRAVKKGDSMVVWRKDEVIRFLI